jgi:2'-5' RNA ligase
VSPSRRLFFALWPDDVVRQRIWTLTCDAVAESRGRPTSSANLHVTVVFLGEVEEDRLPSVRAAGTGAQAEPFDLEFDSIEVWKRSGVLSLTVRETPPAALDLVERLRFRLLEAQFNLRPEDYRPHVTLARRVLSRNVRRALPAIRWHARDFALVESRPGTGGSSYTVLERWPLQKSPAPPDGPVAEPR